MDANTIELLRQNVDSNPSPEMVKAFETMTGQKYTKNTYIKPIIEDNDDEEDEDEPERKIATRPASLKQKFVAPARKSTTHKKNKMCKQIPFEPHEVTHIDGKDILPVYSEEDKKIDIRDKKFVMSQRIRACPLVEVECSKCGTVDIVNQYVIEGKETYYCNDCCGR